MKLRLISGTAAALLAFTAPALAAPVTVDLRIEGETRTLFEGPVTTDTRPFVAADGPHACGSVPTRGAVMAAAIEGGLPVAAEWSDGIGSPMFNSIAGEDVRYNAATNKFLAEYLNGAFADAGSCEEAVANGDRVLFAYATGSEPLLALTGPATAKPGEPVTLTVTDGKNPVAGATVAGATSAADGTVAVGPLTTLGEHDFKAVKEGAIRSNRVRVCVTDGADGACGTTRPPVAPPPAADTAAPAGAFSGLRDKQRLRRGPRELRGSFADASAITTVKLKLRKRLGKKCWYFSGRMERFRGTRCGRGAYFAIDAKADWSYLLPKRLTKGRYVLDAIAIDAAGNRTPLARDKTRVVFTVR